MCSAAPIHRQVASVLSTAYAMTVGSPLQDGRTESACSADADADAQQAGISQATEAACRCTLYERAATARTAPPAARRRCSQQSRSCAHSMRNCSTRAARTCADTRCSRSGHRSRTWSAHIFTRRCTSARRCAFWSVVQSIVHLCPYTAYCTLDNCVYHQTIPSCA